jgi:4-hydroxy-3-polyprenylbenzoate decarboxylase
MICAQEDNPELNINDTKAFFIHMLERIDFKTDLHFITQTTMDTLDYSTQNINQGSKLIMAAAGDKKRKLKDTFPQDFSLPEEFRHPKIILPGIIVLEGPEFSSYARGKIQINGLKKQLKTQTDFKSLPLFVVVDDADFAAKSFSNFLWAAFLRSNPSHDIYGLNEKTIFKHWGCNPPLIIDARIKPFHADSLKPDKNIEARVNALGKKGGPLFGII